MIAAWSRALLFATACSLSACGPKALELPEQPVDRAATCGVVAAAEARAGLDIPEGCFVVGIVGRLQPDKRQDRVIEAIHKGTHALLDLGAMVQMALA